MSSFIINREQYIKAAGFYAGIATTLTRYYEPCIYWYSHSEHRLFESNDYYDAFNKIYEYNCMSVCSQYYEPIPSQEIADDKAQQLFDGYRKIGAALWRKAILGDPLPFKNAVNTFNNFCRCVRYQIDDINLWEKADKFLSKAQYLLFELYMQCDHLKEPDGWAEFALDA